MATKITRRHQLFLGGALWSGKIDQYDRFIRCGIWQSGWEVETDEFMPIMEQMKPGDRIAIKKGLGQGHADMHIRAIGIIKEIDLETSTVYVDWKVHGMKRKVHSRGCFKTLHGPYIKGQDTELTIWINRILCL